MVNFHWTKRRPYKRARLYQPKCSAASAASNQLPVRFWPAKFCLLCLLLVQEKRKCPSRRRRLFSFLVFRKCCWRSCVTPHRRERHLPHPRPRKSVSQPVTPEKERATFIHMSGVYVMWWCLSSPISEFLALKHESRILGHSSNPVCGF